MSKRIWIMAGEASGDLYGAELARALKAQAPDCVLSGMGASRMREAGVSTFIDSTELGIIGIWEALKHVPFFWRLLKQVASRAAAERPETVVLIDYPGFHLQVAKRLHALGIRVVWYVSPQVWAWRGGRIWKLAKCCDRMLCIFPFEPKCYAPTTLKAEFVGHPLLGLLEPFRQRGIARREDTVLLLPGSRRQEIARLLPDFLRAACRIHSGRPGLRYEIALPRPAMLDYAQAVARETKLPADAPEFVWSCGETREKMCAATAAIAASGTVTVEAALLGLPVVVAYKLNWFSWQVARLLIQINTITIANLVCERTVYEERLQCGCTPTALAESLEAILPGGVRRAECLEGIAEFRRRLGAAGDVSRNVARIVLERDGEE